jgi:4-aminobutyrate aminotransferase/(S)-3-amino-2-methylpropionate transaminase
LAEAECRNTTFLVDDWPIFWERAEGANVWDADGNRFLDMTSGFGVAGIGYGFTGVLGALGGAALSTHWGLQTVFWAAIPVALLALLCAVGLLRASRRHAS